MSAKSELFSRLEYVSAATQLPALIDIGISVSNHNGVANLLRKGLGIVTFNILEDFIKKRSNEALDEVSSSGVQFANLTDLLQNRSVFGALSALARRHDLLKKDGTDWREVIQNEAEKIHSTKNPTFALSHYSLVLSGSNVLSKEIPELLEAFGISGGWTTLKSISDQIGGGIPDLAQAFSNATERRHSSAHSANFQYDYAWTRNLKNEILAIAASIDIALMVRIRQIINDRTIKIDQHNLNDGLNFKFLEFNGSLYRQTTSIGGSSRKNWTDLNQAIARIQPSLASDKEFLIVLDNSRRVQNWHF